MKSEMEIMTVLSTEYNHRDGPAPMDEMDWAHNAGWIEALEFVLKDGTPCKAYKDAVEAKKDISHLLEGANDDTIKRAAKRLSENYGFGRKDDAIDSENDSVRDGWLYAPKECTA